MNRIDLSAATFIIPVRIDSPDRARNLRLVLAYLRDNFETNVIIFESDAERKARFIVDEARSSGGCGGWKYWFENTDDFTFLRTRMLNEMLDCVDTPVTVNYDADILLRPAAYKASVAAIVDGGCDLVYPYARGDSQRRVTVPDDPGVDLFDPKYSEPWQSVCGFVQFFRTSAYRAGGMENEGFLSYGAEDVERMIRFQKLGYRVEWLEHPIWHLEHARGRNSGPGNPHFLANEALYRKLEAMTADELRAYYATAPYRQKYANA